LLEIKSAILPEKTINSLKFGELTMA